MIRYQSMIVDNTRWDGFRHRDDDIVITTPPKCGTTWTQMICALLIFQDPNLPAPLSELSPWIDVQTARIDDVRAALDAQTHRRFIKSHTPLDGLPLDGRVTYVCVTRDPRDAWLSWDNHRQNMNLPVVMQARIDAVGSDGLEEYLANMPAEVPEDPRDRFWMWVDEDAPLGQSLGSLKGLLHHAANCTEHRDDPNVVLLRYADMQANLAGEMRRLANCLGIEVREDLWPELVTAATFDEMRSRADTLAPQQDIAGFWLDAANFFRSGSNGAWRGLLDDDDLDRYWTRVDQLATPEVAAWVHGGGAASP